MAVSCTLRDQQRGRSLSPMAGTEIPQGALKTDGQGFFLGGSVVKTLLTNAGGTGLIPWARRIPLAVGQPSACATARACALAPRSRGP